VLHELLSAFEQQLDPADPAAGPFGAEIIGYGEVSAVLSLADLPGRVLKRMSGFPDARSARAYCGVVERYIAILAEIGIAMAPTQLVTLAPETGRHVIYLVQPRFGDDRMGQTILRCGSDEQLRGLMDRVMGEVRSVLSANARRRDGRRVAVDAQLSNWHWPDERAAPVLIDIGTPFMRLHGRLEIGEEYFLRAFPPPLRGLLRRRHVVERYIADYFHFDRSVLDLIGNFAKEGAPARIPNAVAFANEWIAGQPDAAELGRIDEARVRDYYTRDAGTLEWMLRVRRLNRWIHTRLLRRPYDYILPGRIAR
jgi:hypothetical protein